MRVQLAYGRTGLAVDLPAHTCVVASPAVSPLPDEAAALRAALRHPIGSAPLAAKAKAGGHGRHHPHRHHPRHA